MVSLKFQYMRTNSPPVFAIAPDAKVQQGLSLDIFEALSVKSCDKRTGLFHTIQLQDQPVKCRQG